MLRAGKAQRHSSAPGRIPSEFEMVQLKKIKNFVDHNGDYITRTGFKIDDYAILSEDEIREIFLFKLKRIFRKTFCK